MEYTILNNGVKMPLVGLGVMEIENGAAGEQVILDALNAGYRMIDTATVYFNEETVGAAIKKSGIPREELFITSKFWAQDAGYENTKKAFQLSLDYLDIHHRQPCKLHRGSGLRHCLQYPRTDALHRGEQGCYLQL